MNTRKKSEIPSPQDINYKDKFTLEGKVVVITGARGIIGEAFVEACAQYGANVVLVDMASTKPEEMAAELSQRFDRKMLGLAINVAKRNEVESLKAKVLSEFGKIDSLVNCHHYKPANFFARFEDYKDEDWDSIIEVNLKGTFLTCQILGTWMSENGGGNIVNMPSTYSVVAPNQYLYKDTTFGCPAVYPASKGGIMALSMYLSTYWADKKVRVNQITPHGVLRYGNWDSGKSSFEERFSSLSPMHRMSYNHEVAGALIYLLSDASSYVTGHNLMVDGGWSVW